MTNKPTKKSQKKETSDASLQLSDYSIDGVLIFNQDQQLCYYNKAALEFLKTTKEDLEKKLNLRELRKSSKIFEQISNLIFQLKKANNLTSTLRTEDSILGIRCFETDISLFGGKCYETVIIDSTTLIEEQKEATKVEKINALTQFTNGIAHEINNPLAGISNAVYLLKSGKLSQEKQISIIEKINENIGRITAVIDNLRQYAHQETASENYIDVSDVINDVISVAKLANSSAVAEVEYNAPEDKIEVFGALNEFRQLVYNIVLNAFQAMPDGGKLSISLNTVVEAGKKQARITITDTGCGIAQEEIDYVFNPFYTRKRIWNSLGLGLSVAYRIAQYMHGDIEIKSNSGKGTTVIITIPTV